jgi:hypothetical protein
MRKIRLKKQKGRMGILAGQLKAKLESLFAFLSLCDSCNAFELMKTEKIITNPLQKKIA